MDLPETYAPAEGVTNAGIWNTGQFHYDNLIPQIDDIFKVSQAQFHMEKEYRVFVFKENKILYDIKVDGWYNYRNAIHRHVPVSLWREFTYVLQIEWKPLEIPEFNLQQDVDLFDI